MSPLTGGKDHLSHRLVRKGISHRVAAILLWAGSGLFALLAIGIYSAPKTLGTPFTYLAAAIWAVALICFLRIPSED
jgi:UDP-GlcNAc:undecaprenyl-phosphate GlcNAc-1-phosphate transferase